MTDKLVGKKKTVNKYGNEIELDATQDTFPVKENICSILEACNIPYKTEWNFNGKGLKQLKYDVAVFDGGDSDTPCLLIEYDGPGHYDPSYYSRCGVRKVRLKAHVVAAALGEARKLQVALQYKVPLIRITKLHLPMLRDILLSYISTFTGELPATNSREIKMVTMLDRYGWDFTYVEKSDPTKEEKAFLVCRDSTKEETLHDE